MNPVGDATAGMPGLCTADEPGKYGAPKGKPLEGWLLEAEEVGIGGEKGKDDGKFEIEGWRLMLEPGEMDGGGGGSSLEETPSALSFAS